MRTQGRLAAHQQKSERTFLLRAMRRFHGNNTAMAHWLGVSRRALYDKLREHGLEGEASALRAEAGVMGPRGARGGGEAPGADQETRDAT